jgi:hypothetical protein
MSLGTTPVRDNEQDRPEQLPADPAAAGMAGVKLRIWSIVSRVGASLPTGTRRELLPVVVVAAVLRFVDLGAVGLNSDEAVYAGQAASLANNPHFSALFPIVRAHPLLMQITMSWLYARGIPDTPGRYVAALFGVGTVALVYLLGRILYDRRVATIGALLLAVMPYHVVVSRQIMLDGPMAFFATGALVCLAVAGTKPARARWLVAAGACLGLAALTKETGIIFIGGAFVFLSLVNHLWRPLRFPLAGLAVALMLAFSYPILTAVSGGSHGGQSYLLWQLTRQPNHSFTFYATAVGASMGVGLLALSALGLVPRLSGRRLTWRETLLLSWIVAPLMFFEIWPVKGFSYLEPMAPVVAVLAARALSPLPGVLLKGWRRVALSGLTVAAVASVAIAAVVGIANPVSSGLAGAGGLPGGREVGQWVDTHVPQGARLMTIGPSMANIIQYYSGRRSDGLSVSPNPLHRNPTYHPITNADAALKAGDYQYIVWDQWSASRSPHFAATALTLMRRFGGYAIHEQPGSSPGHPAVVIYEVSP